MSQILCCVLQQRHLGFRFFEIGCLQLVAVLDKGQLQGSQSCGTPPLDRGRRSGSSGTSWLAGVRTVIHRDRASRLLSFWKGLLAAAAKDRNGVCWSLSAGSRRIL